MSSDDLIKRVAEVMRYELCIVEDDDGGDEEEGVSLPELDAESVQDAARAAVRVVLESAAAKARQPFMLEGDVTDADRAKALEVWGWINNAITQDRDEWALKKIAHALADAEQAEREAIANWHDRQARYYKSNEMYPAYCLNAQVSTHEESAAAIRARGTPAKEKTDG